MAGRFTTSTVPLDYSGTVPDPASGITIVMWAYLTASTGTWSEVWRLRDTGGTTKFFFGAGANGTELTGASIAGSFPTSPSAFAFTAGAWSRIAMTVTGTTGVLYGAASTGAVSTGTGTVSGGGTAGAYALGGRSASDLTENWNGRIAAAKVYAAALTLAEIEAEWAQYAPSRLANLHGWYPLVNATELADFSGNGRTLASSAPEPTTEDGPPIPWQRIRSRIVLPAAATGGTQTAAASLTGTASVTASATVTKSDAASLTETATLTATAATTKTGGTSVTTSAAITAAGTVTRSDAETAPTSTAVISPTGTSTKPATAAVTETVTIVATATHSRAGQSTLTATATVTAAGTVTKPVAAAVAVNATVIATAVTGGGDTRVDITVQVGPTRQFTTVGVTRGLNDGLGIGDTHLL